MRSSIKRLFSRWHLDNIKVVRRVIVSVVGATVVLIGIALLVLPGPAFVVIPVGLAILATEYAWARRWLRKVRRMASDVVSGRKRTSIRDLVSSSHCGRAGETRSQRRRTLTAKLEAVQQRCAEDSARYGRTRNRKSTSRCRSGLIRQRIPMSTAPLVCQICKKSKSPNSGMIAELIRPSLLEFIKKKVPDLDSKAFICFEDLGEFRKDYVKEVLEDEIGELSALDQEVIESLEQHEILSSDIIKQFERKLTFGERLSDRIAEFGGSWKFLITFGAVILVWIAINGIMLATRAFDPLSIYIAKSGPLLPGCGAGAGYHDESKPFRGARPIAGGK